MSDMRGAGRMAPVEPPGTDDCRFELDAYAFDLPQELIAQEPSAQREGSRLLVLDRAAEHLAHRRFEEVTAFLRAGDVLVLNDTRVVPARLHGAKDTGGNVELLVLEPYRSEEGGYACLVRSSKSVKPGSRIHLRNGVSARVLERPVDGKTRVSFEDGRPLLEILEAIGEVPLPPYIHRDGTSGTSRDIDTYQTVYARIPGAVAAPTAGLHFSESLLAAVRALGVEVLTLTLHVGYGTFAPIRESDIRNHEIHSEYVRVPQTTARRIRHAKERGGRVVAVGTTVVRSLEWAAAETGIISERSGLCGHYIHPPYRFAVVDAMITNFHLPKSSLLLLVSAFAGRESILNAYRVAVAERYRFFSYGDAMLLC